MFKHYTINGPIELEVIAVIGARSVAKILVAGRYTITVELLNEELKKGVEGGYIEVAKKLTTGKKEKTS